ncbi:hypothetical protein [Bradyrhizobium sp. CB3481]|uniref:O-antigen ligase family protein n=1 Tax=Bradyrhizobium sp. CB3481 TaxID=3039158 RepID=UPI0024B212EE|nr:hypothetical protein [Bradyrhizobium sp. CB3481]WFU18784.1 hypothetical protein QA643_10830 [Bradyrhizobium sp. CB3481]
MEGEASATANWFANVALLSWPAVAVILYRTRPFSEATVWTILGALLLLPSQVSIKFQMIPAIDKSSISSFCALVGCFLLAPRAKRTSVGFGLAGLLATICILGPVITSLLNNDNVVIGGRLLPAVGLYDGISALLSQLIFLLPFFIGRRFLREARDVEALLLALALAGLVYSLPMLFEVRMSPQLSTWIYGYFPSSYAGEMRYGGYRPVVFMNNGLVAAFFLSTSVLAAVVLWRARSPIHRFPAGAASAYLLMVLILCKSAGALVYATVLGFLVRFTKPITQVRVAVLLVSIAMLYPVLRVTNLFPDQQLVDLASSFNQERADSLKFRFDQERQLLAHASERFVFGWGRHGRNRVYEESGRDASITDGLWILTLGQFGFAGFIAQFGLLTLPVIRAATALKRINKMREKMLLAALALIVAATAIEQLPNASLTAWSWLLVGALLGRVEEIRLTRSRSRSLNVFQDELERPKASVPLRERAMFSPANR